MNYSKWMAVALWLCAVATYASEPPKEDILRRQEEEMPLFSATNAVAEIQPGIDPGSPPADKDWSNFTCVYLNNTWSGKVPESWPTEYRKKPLSVQSG